MEEEVGVGKEGLGNGVGESREVEGGNKWGEKKTGRGGGGRGGEGRKQEGEEVGGEEGEVRGW